MKRTVAWAVQGAGSIGRRRPGVSFPAEVREVGAMKQKARGTLAAPQGRTAVEPERKRLFGRFVRDRDWQNCLIRFKRTPISGKPLYSAHKVSLSSGLDGREPLILKEE